MKTNLLMLAMCLALGACKPETSVEKAARKLPFESTFLEHIEIGGTIAVLSRMLTKYCIDGQAYLITQDGGVSASFKDGKPEQCQVKVNN